MSGAVTVNIVNRNYPPHAGITGESAAELAEYLERNGVTVSAIHVDSAYVKGKTSDRVQGKSYSVKTFYGGKNKLLRLFSNLYEAVRLLAKSRSLNPDLTICMTDPPFLSICAALMLGKRRPWILWSMDLYPEAFSASKLVSSRNPIYRLLERVVYRNRPRHLIALGEHQADYLRGKFVQGISCTVLPCGIYVEREEPTSDVPAWADAGSRTILGYCGNIGEAHSVEFLISVIDNLDSAKHKLILAPYGTNARRVLDYATGKPGVEIVPFVNRDHLKHIDIHLASLKSEWVNVCVPSKTVSSVCAGSAFLYHGKRESDNWNMLEAAGWKVDPGSIDLGEAIRVWLAAAPRELEEKKNAARRLSSLLNEQKLKAFQEIHRVVLDFAARVE